MMYRYGFWRSGVSELEEFWRPPDSVLNAGSVRDMYARYTGVRLVAEDREAYSSTLSYGKYDLQLARYRAFFPPSQLLVLRFESLFPHASGSGQPAELSPETMRLVAAFLDIADIWSRKKEAGPVARVSSTVGASERVTEQCCRFALACCEKSMPKDVATKRLSMYQRNRTTPMITRAACSKLRDFYALHNERLYSLLALRQRSGAAWHLQPDFPRFPEPPCRWQ